MEIGRKAGGAKMSRLITNEKTNGNRAGSSAVKRALCGFLKRHIGLIVLGILVLLVSAAAIAVGLNPDFGASLFHRGAASVFG